MNFLTVPVALKTKLYIIYIYINNNNNPQDIKEDSKLATKSFLFSDYSNLHVHVPQCYPRLSKSALSLDFN